MDPNEPLSGGSDASLTIVSASESSSSDSSEEKKPFLWGECRATSLLAVMSCQFPSAAQPGAIKAHHASREGPLAAVAKSAALRVISFRIVRKAFFFGCSIGSTGFFLMMDTSSMASVTFRARDRRAISSFEKRAS